ncbi:alpha/beta hydrolase [Streptomyces mirabilis]|uniref:alpha/beta hydrolase n=1 Tax=Streptomyces mirabilis TaxID=68239 RepID=UPI00363DD1E8
MLAGPVRLVLAVECPCLTLGVLGRRILALVVGSANDPYCTPEAAVDFAERWAARWHPAGACGHIDSAGGLGPWPHGRELLDSLTRL